MKLPPILRAAAVVILLAIASHTWAADSAAQINAKLKAGNEIAWLVEDSTDRDGDLAVLFTARLKGKPTEKFPYRVRGDLSPAETDALSAFDDASGEVTDEVVMENIIVSLKEKRVLGRLSLGKPEGQIVYFPGRNHGSLEVMWGPGQEGTRFGILNFGGKWDSSAVILVESDGERIRQLDIKPVLDAKANAFIKTALKGKKGIDAARYAIPYRDLQVVDPDVGYSVGNPVKITLNFEAEVPKAPNDEPSVEGAMTVVLETSPGKISARVLKVAPPKK